MPASNQKAYVLLNIRVEQYFNSVIVFNYELQEPLHFGSTVKTKLCENHCNLKQTHYNYVAFLRSLTESFLSIELDIIDSLNLSHCFLSIELDINDSLNLSHF